MGTWSGRQRVCCSCRFWSGGRDINFTATTFKALDSKGKCNGPAGSFRGLEMRESASCSKWEAFR
ncbi:hypothetical protein FY534_03590 [Alicyclobacillus sp. TC]|nr:hypothetical protein FY534_03590 [Alicyclobacillus sp. TC]